MNERRRLALALLAAGWLAGCASRPASRTSAGGAVGTGGGGVRRAPAVPTPPSLPPLNLDPAEREGAVANAMLLVNTPYTYGGNTPQGGFDCSGLIQYVFQQVTGGTRRLPRSTAQWAASTVPVQDAQMQRGDLVFFNTTGTPFSHMGLLVGDEQFVHAPSSGGIVRKASLDNRYFATRYLGARRVFAT
ncbi:C40 family peptidase [Ottowia sp.]|uniref:C40 family peptidase n=1 Tax=Ottowia sp. TaxID=1898956 RepID=UPI0025F09A58|nr:C40 family peptidase [Ottowia sp.]